MPLYGVSTGDSIVRVVKRPESYGAKRDGKAVHDAAMTNGSAVLTSASAPFLAADAGKAICVVGAGAAGVVLSTTILSYQSATQVTLSAASNATISSKQALWGTDDAAAITAALNAAVTACQANSTYYCEVQFSAGIYVIAAATTKGGSTLGNAQIPLPAIEPATGQKVTIVLRGLADSGGWMHWLQTRGQKSGAVLRTMLVGQTPDGTYNSPSVIGANTVDLASTSVFSNIRVVVDNLTVSTPIDPSVIGIDLRGAAQADVKCYSALADGIPSDLINPANSNGIGLYLPRINNNDSCNVDIYSCEGFYYGMAFSDHLVARRLGLIYCNTGMYINAASGTRVHGSSILYASIEACSTGIEKSNSSNNVYPLHIAQVNTEGVTTAIKDPSDNLRGFVGWTNIDNTDPVVTGCTHLRVDNMFRPRGNLTAPAVPASTVASTPIFRDAVVTVSGGVVTVIAVDAVTTGLTSGTFVVPANKTITITYSVVPTWKWTLL